MKSKSVTIQMKAIPEQYFPLVLFITLYKVVLTFECQWMKSFSVIIQMEASVEDFPLVQFCKLYKVVLTSQCADEILRVTIHM